jgi:nicotinate-nucleotide pyrophosphorylase (carboxylating)
MAGAAQPFLSDLLLAEVIGTHRALVKTTEPGVIAGLSLLNPGAAPGPVGAWKTLVEEGMRVEAGAAIVEVTGTASEIILAEDHVLGPIGFASGVATRAGVFARMCPPGLHIACGGWKKLPFMLKPMLHAGLTAAGILPRLIEGDFLYVGKNSVRLLGGVERAIAAGIKVGHGPVAVQVKDAGEALFAARAGAGVIMVDTGDIGDLEEAHRSLVAAGLRDGRKLAFGGGVRIDQLVAARDAGADAVDVGRAIIDAPLLDLRMEVQ